MFNCLNCLKYPLLQNIFQPLESPSFLWCFLSLSINAITAALEITDTDTDTYVSVKGRHYCFILLFLIGKTDVLI